MRSIVLAVALFSVGVTDAVAATITFATAPFEGTTALSTPGRQIVGGEDFIDFNPATDVFAFDPVVFDVASILFFNGEASDIPATGVNVVVLETFDNDSNAATAFGAGTAANLIANEITSSTPGFFIYFNSGLDLARLVYSTDLGDEAADLKIMARLQNISGQSGREALPLFTAANFVLLDDDAVTPVPEPSSLLLLGSGIATVAAKVRKRRKQKVQ